MTLIQTASAGENLFFFLVVGVMLLFKIIKAAQEQQQRRPDKSLDTFGDSANDDWQDWELPAATAPPEAAAQPAARPIIAVAKPVPEPPPIPSRAQTEARIDTLRTAPPPEAPWQPVATRRYIKLDVPAEPATPQPRQAAVMSATRSLMDESLDTAFPAAPGVKPLTPRTSSRTVRVRARGRKAVRRAVLLSEVIGPPRAFDV